MDITYFAAQTMSLRIESRARAVSPAREGALVDPANIEVHVIDPAGDVTEYVWEQGNPGVDIERIGLGLFRLVFSVPTPGPWSAEVNIDGVIERVRWTVQPSSFQA